MALGLSWEIRDRMWVFAEKGRGRDFRLPTLLQLMLHADIRLRAWPSRRTLARNTGADESTISSAIGWLVDHGAIYIVPHELRVGQERSLDKRANVYQLTGVILVNGEFVPYLSMPPEVVDNIIRELQDPSLRDIGRKFQPNDGEQVENSNMIKVENFNTEDSPYIEDGNTERHSQQKQRTPGKPRVYVPTVAQKSVAFDVAGVEVNDDGDIDEPLDSLEEWILAVTGAKKLAKTYRGQLRKKITWVDDDGEIHKDVSAISVWKEEEFRKFFRENIIPSLDDKNLLKPKFVVQRLTSGNIRKWYRSTHGATSNNEPEKTPFEFETIPLDEARKI